MLKFACAGFALLVLGAWGPQRVPDNPLDPGGNSSPPGSGCQVGTSGCFPSAPPGPVTPAPDPGGATEDPPPVTQTDDVPFYGRMPGAPAESNQTLLSPTMQLQVQQQAADEARAQQQAADQARDEQRQQIIDQQQQIIDQQNELLEQKQQQPEPKAPAEDGDQEGLPVPRP